MILAIGFYEAIASLGEALGIAVIVLLCAFVVGWLCHCILSIARAANALERIADALEDKDTEEKGDKE